jgi:hypothetical protein
MKLVSNWREGHKFWSNRLLAAALFLQAGWPAIAAAMPPSLVSRLPAEFSQWVVFLLVVLAFLARFVDQGLGSAPAAQEGGGDDA